MLLETFLRAVESRRLLRRGDSGAVAFSGGGDSLCLLHLLQRIRREWDLSLQAVVVDHGLRPESADEAQRAAELARTLGLQPVVIRVSVSREGNLQQEAREVRQRLLLEHALAHRLAWVALGHTATDQAETVLMRAVRGTGVAGLGAMRWRRPLDEEVWLIRPLLGVTREEVAAYLELHGLSPVVDPTNETDGYLRNRIRRQVLPLLSQENPQVVRSLCRLAECCHQEDEALAHLAAEVLGRCEGEAGVRVEPLRPLPVGLVLRVLRLAHARATGTARRLERRHVEALLDLVQREGSGAVADVPGARVERRYGELVWNTRSGASALAAELGSDEAELQIAEPGATELADGRILNVTLETVEDQPPASLLDLQRVRFPLVVRPPLPGDRIAVGPDQSRKVARVLLDAKVPRTERPAVPVLLQGREVVMVVGLRRAWGWGPRQGQLGLVVRLGKG